MNEGIVQDISLDVSPFSNSQTTYFLYEIDGVLYNEVDGELSELVDAELNEQTMIENGNETYNVDLLSSVPSLKLHIYEQDPSVIAYDFNYTLLYKGQLIVQEYDFDASNPNKLIITATINANDVIRFLLSNDEGNTWYTYRNKEVIPTSLDDIEQEGLSNIQINNLSRDDLAAIVNGTGKLRLAIFMKQAKSNVKMKLNHIRLEYMVG